MPSGRPVSFAAIDPRNPGGACTNTPAGSLTHTITEVPMLRLAFAAALAALATGAPTATAGDEAKTTIAKAIEAQGGEALLKKYQATTAKFKGKIHTEFGD